MKLLLTFLSGIFLVTGCNNIQKPARVVSEYLKAIDNLEIEKANAFLLKNPNNQKALDNIKSYANSLNEEKKKEMIVKAKDRVYNIIEKQISESTALIVATNNEGTFTSVITFELIKDKGKWLIKNFNKDVG